MGISKSFADTVEIIGKNRLLGEEQGRTIDARQREEEARASQAAESMRAAQAESDLRKVKKQNKELSAQLAAAQAAVAERDATITEWMHSSEAFKRLQRQYGTEIGLTVENRQLNFANAIREVAKEDHRFANTDLLRNLKP